jgi:hypothetical protein
VHGDAERVGYPDPVSIHGMQERPRDDLTVDARASAPRHDFAEFTERGYRGLVETARGRFTFEPFDTRATTRHVLWRHDVDISVHRALALARIEAEVGVRSTWFLCLRSSFYNLFEASVATRARALLGLGHWLGLHVDVSTESELDADALAGRVAWERRVLEDLLGHPVTAVSFHNPDVRTIEGMRADTVAGLPNAYGSGLCDRYPYVSDSNGYWRFRELRDVLLGDGVDRVQVLTHPEWWPPEPMSPRARIARSVEGRARDCLTTYDALLAEHGRVNVA